MRRRFTRYRPRYGFRGRSRRTKTTSGIATFIVAAVVLLIIGFMIGDQAINQEDITVVIRDKDHYVTYSESCSDLDDDGYETCYETETDHYSVMVGEGKWYNVSGRQTWRSFDTDSRYNVRICGKIFVVLCKNLGRVQ